jgi:WD40 repeat protein
MLWNAATGERLATYTGHDNTIYGIAFSPVDPLMATASFDRTILVWDINADATE